MAQPIITEGRILRLKIRIIPLAHPELGNTLTTS